MNQGQNKKSKEEENFSEFLKAFNQQISVINEKLEIVGNELFTLNEDKNHVLEDILSLENEEEALKTKEGIETSEEVLEENFSEEMEDLLEKKNFLRQDLSSLEGEIYTWELHKKALLEEKNRLILFSKLFQDTTAELTREREKVVSLFNILLQIAQEMKKENEE
jgi:hypothetical protein